MGKIKVETRRGKVSEVISAAYDEIRSLAEDCREVVDNASDGLSQTQRIQTLDETASTLENYGEEPTTPTDLDVEMEYGEWRSARKGRALSRADRCAWTASMLEQVSSQLETRIEELGGEDADESGEARELRDSLDECRGEIEGLEFPGMYG